MARSLSELKIFRLGVMLLIAAFLSSSAAMLSFSNTFLLLLAFIGLLFFSEAGSPEFKASSLFYFSLTLLLISFFLISHVVFFIGWDFLFTYQADVFVKLLLCIPVIWLIYSVQLTGREIILIFAMAGTYAVFYSTAVWLEGSPRGQGLLESPIHLGNLAVTFSLISLVLFFYTQSFWLKIWLFIIFLFAFFLSVQTGSKGGWVAVVLVSLSIGVYLFFVSKKMFWLFIGLLFGVMSIMAAIWEQLPVGPRLYSAYEGWLGYWSEGQVTEGSVGPRLEIWRSVWLGMADFNLMQWLFGIGFMGFESHWREFVESGESLITSEHPHPHNDFLQLIFEFGLFGLFLFGALLFIPLKVFFKGVWFLKDNDKFIAFSGIILAEMYLEFMLSDQNIFVKQLLFNYVVLSALLMSLVQKKTRQQLPLLNNKEM
ncbi:MAG: O-antigen ligase family protein [Hydrogenovibrio sp.]|uniref:O-antigen ligase family protein n=1 Tax=Hydrogenovibrio sp. TaxID=2065821 RepID=UPI00286FCEB8|nr:O-antigen ligase family protein [Hydrogenovibrio sp.]MDR9500048.1 O-antigen ligase family protein [Hydrogenovibrio sp.]